MNQLDAINYTQTLDNQEYVEYILSILAFKSCKTCEFSTEPYPDLYKCNNTEINLTSNQRETFYCSKWKVKEQYNER